MAAAQGAAWVAVSVESSRTLAPEARRRLEQNLALARELGAEVVVTHDDNVAKALVRIALQHNATQIVIGKSRTPRLLDWLRGGSLVNRLLRRCGTIDLYVVPAERAAEQTSLHLEWLPPEDSPAREYLDVLLALATLTLASWFLAPHTGYLFIGLLYLLAVVALGLRVGRLPVFVAGVASALTWNFVFIPPVFTFAIAKFEDGMMFATYFAVALITGHRHADFSHRRRGSGPRARLPHRRRSRSRPAARDARQPLQKVPTRRRRARWWIGTRPFDHPRLRCRPRRRNRRWRKPRRRCRLYHLPALHSAW